MNGAGPIAVLAIVAELGWPWRAAGALRAIPRGWRDAAYRRIARSRYRLFGRHATYRAANPGQKSRIL